MGQGSRWTEAQRASRLDKLVERNRSGHGGTFLYENADWMRTSYVERGLTLRQIAAEAGCGLRTAARWMETHGIPTDRSRCGDRLTDRKGSKHPCWRDNDITYEAAHMRVVAERGRAAEYACQHCGDPAREWAYAHSDPDELRRPEEGRRFWYSPRPVHYMPLCASCHRRFDNVQRPRPRRSHAPQR